MKQTEKNEFNELVIDVLDFYRANFSVGIAGIWWRLLKSYELADIRKAFDKHITSNRFMPTVAHITDLIHAAKKYESKKVELPKLTKQDDAEIREIMRDVQAQLGGEYVKKML